MTECLLWIKWDNNYKSLRIVDTEYVLSWVNHWYISWKWEKTYISVWWLWFKNSDSWFWQIDLYKWWTLVVPLWKWKLEISRKWLNQPNLVINWLRINFEDILWRSFGSQEVLPNELRFSFNWKEISIPMDSYKKLWFPEESRILLLSNWFTIIDKNWFTELYFDNYMIRIMYDRVYIESIF